MRQLPTTFRFLLSKAKRKADLLWSWSVAATCNAGGAKKWKPEHSAFLKGADVFLLPDNDDPGWAHIHQIGSSLAGIAKSVRVLVLPNLPSKGDIVDWAAAGGTREQLEALLAQAPEWQPPSANDSKDTEGKAKATASEDALIAALAKMRPGIEFARARSRLAKNLGIARSDVDAEVRRVREDAEIAPLYGHWIVEPWPEPCATATHCCATLSVASNGTLLSATTAFSRSVFGSCWLGFTTKSRRIVPS